MARTLNWSGGNSHVIALFAGDDDNTLGYWNASGRVTPDITQNGGAVTAESLTWNGHTVVGLYDGTSTDNMPKWRFNSGYPTFATTGTFFMLIGNKKNTNINTSVGMGDNGGNNIIVGVASEKLSCSGYVGATSTNTTAVANGNYFGIFFTYDQSDSAKRNTWYGLAGGTIVKEAGPWNFGTTPSTRLLVFMGQNTGQTVNWPGDFVAGGYVDVAMTEPQMQAINDDPYGAFFPAGGASTKSKSFYLSTQMSNA